MSQSLIHQVSVSEIITPPSEAENHGMSQSLIHQVSVSERLMIQRLRLLNLKSQSLIHQVSVSEENKLRLCKELNEVSIPYSSGLSFRDVVELTDKEKTV